MAFKFHLCFTKRLANGSRFSRREASAASEAVGWKRMLGGYRFSQGLLPMNSFTAAILSFSSSKASGHPLLAATS
jgi:hypothetical protein